MCIVIDTNSLASVFEKSSANHQDFAPVLDWVKTGKGKVVYGGTRFCLELGKYLKLFKLLNSAGKAVFVDSKLVDQEEMRISGLISHADFDDQHLVALLLVSKCKIICSQDKRAFPYFRHPMLFGSKAARPRIYKSNRNSNLLSDLMIAEICKPCSPTTKAQLLALQL